MQSSKSRGKRPAAALSQPQHRKASRAAAWSGCSKAGKAATTTSTASSKATWPAGVRSGRGSDTAVASARAATGGTAVASAPRAGGRQPSKRREMLVGKRIDVWWASEERYWRGTVLDYDVGDKTHQIVYDDGEIAWHLLEDFFWRRYCGAPWIRPKGGGSYRRGRAMDRTATESAAAKVAAKKKTAAKARAATATTAKIPKASKVGGRTKGNRKIGGQGLGAAAAAAVAAARSCKKPQRKMTRRSCASSYACTARSRKALGRRPDPIRRTRGDSDNKKNDDCSDYEDDVFFPCSDGDASDDEGIGRHSPYVRPICSVTVAPLAESEDEVDGILFVQGSRLQETTVLTDRSSTTTVHRLSTTDGLWEVAEAPCIHNLRPRVPGTPLALTAGAGINLVTKAPTGH